MRVQKNKARSIAVTEVNQQDDLVYLDSKEKGTGYKDTFDFTFRLTSSIVEINRPDALSEF